MAGAHLANFLKRQIRILTERASLHQAYLDFYKDYQAGLKDLIPKVEEKLNAARQSLSKKLEKLGYTRPERGVRDPHAWTQGMIDAHPDIAGLTAKRDEVRNFSNSNELPHLHAELLQRVKQELQEIGRKAAGLLSS